MREIAYTTFGRNALFIGLISHVAAIIVVMMPARGTDVFFSVVYTSSWLAFISGVYAELKNRGYMPFGNWRFYIISVATTFPILGPLTAFWMLYRLQRGGEEDRVRVWGMCTSVLKLRANIPVIFIFVVILFILFAVIIQPHDPYLKRKNLNRILPQPASTSEKPEIFVQLAKESIIYFSGLKFVQEVQI